MQTSMDECTREVIETVPLVMRTIRSELRRHGAQELSVPQFRVLGFLNRNKGSSLSEVAEHIGLTLPSMSALIDGLVNRNLATRRTHPYDRRRMTLELTQRGENILRSARDATNTYLAERLQSLSREDRSKVAESMRILRSVFAGKMM
jgi:DNA-binding MarR family transcriptional regulator